MKLCHLDFGMESWLGVFVILLISIVPLFSISYWLDLNPIFLFFAGGCLIVAIICLCAEVKIVQEKVKRK